MAEGTDMHNVESFPLHWPDGWVRTEPESRQDAVYRVTFKQAKSDLHRELRLLGATDVVISSNVPSRKDGEPQLKFREPDDPGVAVYWSLKNKPQVMACDKWTKVRHNLRAVGLAVGALRQLERTGASEILDRAFQGFNALPSQGVQEHWRSTLGFDPEQAVTAEMLKKRYRDLVRRCHPDHGGSKDEFRRVHHAFEMARHEIEREVNRP